MHGSESSSIALAQQQVAMNFATSYTTIHPKSPLRLGLRLTGRAEICRRHTPTANDLRFPIRSQGPPLNDAEAGAAGAAAGWQVWVPGSPFLSAPGPGPGEVWDSA